MVNSSIPLPSQSPSRSPLPSLRSLAIACLLLPTGLLNPKPAVCQTFDPSYRFVQSSSPFRDKAFYFLTVLAELPAARQAIAGDKTLDSLFNERVQQLKALPDQCKDSTACYLAGLSWEQPDNRLVGDRLAFLLKTNPAFRHSIKDHLRASGNFIRYDSLDDETCLRRLWQDAADAIDYSLKAYMLNEKMRWAAIDSTHYPAAGHYYRDLLHEMVMVIARRTADMHLFFDPSLTAVSELLTINGRDEATRYDLSALDAAAYAKIPTIKWPDYPYSAILVLGEGPEDETVPLSPHGKYRCELAAALYRDHKAPLIIVSGGPVHPFQTPYSEAMEMRRWLMDKWGIPASAILTDPVARHTTTNLRNGNRLIFRGKLPAQKPVLGITGQSQVDYILSARFSDRCMQELGYRPFHDLSRTDAFCFSYYPEKLSLQVDAMDPLDP